jgi:hypothetical protein
MLALPKFPVSLYMNIEDIYTRAESCANLKKTGDELWDFFHVSVLSEKKLIDYDEGIMLELETHLHSFKVVAVSLKNRIKKIDFGIREIAESTYMTILDELHFDIESSGRQIEFIIYDKVDDKFLWLSLTRTIQSLVNDVLGIIENQKF